MSLPRIWRNGIEYHSLPDLGHGRAAELVGALWGGEIDYAVIRDVPFTYDQLHGPVEVEEDIERLYRAVLEKELGRKLVQGERAGSFALRVFGGINTPKHVDFMANRELLVQRAFFNVVTQGMRRWDLFAPRENEDTEELAADAKSLTPEEFAAKYYVEDSYHGVVLHGPKTAAEGDKTEFHDMIMVRGGVSMPATDIGRIVLPTCHEVSGLFGSQAVGLFVAPML